jgi:hypothetical protein
MMKNTFANGLVIYWHLFLSTTEVINDITMWIYCLLGYGVEDSAMIYQSTGVTPDNNNLHNNCNEKLQYWSIILLHSTSDIYGSHCMKRVYPGAACIYVYNIVTCRPNSRQRPTYTLTTIEMVLQEVFSV